MPSARSPNASFSNTASLVVTGVIPAAASASRAARASGPGQQRLADEGLDDLDAGIDGAAHLAGAVDEGQAAPVALASVAQGRDRRDPRVGAAGQLGRGRGGHLPTSCLARRAGRRHRGSSRRPPASRARGRPRRWRPAAARTPASSVPASRSPTEAGRVGGQEDEAARLEDRAQPRPGAPQVVLEAPGCAAGAVAVGRRVEDDPVVPPPAPGLALDERTRVVDDPADRPVGQPGQLRVAPWPRRPPGARRRRASRTRPRPPGPASRAPCTRTGCSTDTAPALAEPGQHRGMLGEEPDLARLGRPQLEGQSSGSRSVQGPSPARGPVQPRSRSKRRSAAAHASGSRRSSSAEARADRRHGRRTARVGRRRRWSSSS